MRNRLAVSLIALAAAFVFTLAGCDKDQAPGLVKRDPIAGRPLRVVVEDTALARGLFRGEPVVTAPSDNTPMRVSVPVRSTVDRYALNIQYKYEFFDRRGRMTGDTGWIFKALQPRSPDYLEGSATDTDAVDWRLKIRPGR